VSRNFGDILKNLRVIRLYLDIPDFKFGKLCRKKMFGTIFDFKKVVDLNICLPHFCGSAMGSTTPVELLTKIVKYYSEKNSYFMIKIAIYLPLGLREGRQSNREAANPQK
jgi:hypothetical protein